MNIGDIEIKNSLRYDYEKGFYYKTLTLNIPPSNPLETQIREIYKNGLEKMNIELRQRQQIIREEIKAK